MKPYDPDVQVLKSSTSCIRSPTGNRTESPIATEPDGDRLMRRLEVQRVTGLSRSALYRLMAEKDFPAQIHLSAKAVGWLSSEVHAWVAARVAARG